ncbi:hypothetical protein LY13_000650 [Prauserella aidingensis]|nr:hypothetical protein [Prauserella aidingensis]
MCGPRGRPIAHHIACGAGTSPKWRGAPAGPVRGGDRRTGPAVSPGGDRRGRPSGRGRRGASAGRPSRFGARSNPITPAHGMRRTRPTAPRRRRRRVGDADRRACGRLFAVATPAPPAASVTLGRKRNLQTGPVGGTRLFQCVLQCVSSETGHHRWEVHTMKVGDMVDCPRCHGSGLTPNRKGPCPNCGGLGQVPQRQGRGERPRRDGPRTEVARAAGRRGPAVSSRQRAVINNSVTSAQ